MQPVEDAFARHWRDAERFNVLDDSLSVERSRAGRLTDALSLRIAALARYASDAGADGILYTCSAFGAAIEAVQRSSRVPVLKPNEAMFDAALAQGRRLGLLASFAPTLPALEEELRAQAPDAETRSACAPQAMAALQAGDAARHDALLAEAARGLEGCDVIMLAQFSTARARDAVAAVTRCPVLTSPDSAVQRMRSLL